MRKHMVETVMGVVVLLIAALFVLFVYQTAQVRAMVGYEVSAVFFKVGGLTKGANVRINGIKVGSVTKSKLDMQTFDAIVTMSIHSDVHLPIDTVAAIGSEGVFGGKYVRLKPGNSQNFIAPGGSIVKTENYKSLEDQVSEIIFLATNPNRDSSDSP